jgi:hypothetical protein
VAQQGGQDQAVGGDAHGFRCDGTGSGASGRGGAGCSAWGDASGVRCGRASLPPMTVAVSCVTREEDGPSIPESPCAAIDPGIITICEAVGEGRKLDGGELGHLGHQQHQDQGIEGGGRGGLARPALGGPHDQMRCIFPEAFGIPAPNTPRFSGWSESRGLLRGRLDALLSVDGPLVRVP